MTDDEHLSPDTEDFYDPYQEYVNQKKKESMQGEAGLPPERLPDANSQHPSRLPSYRSEKRKPTRLETAGFVLSLASMFCCCCSSIYISLGAAIMSIAVCICSRFFYNEEGRFHPTVIAGMIISTVSIVLILFLVFFYLKIYPQLLDDPQFRQIMDQMQSIQNGT